MTQDTTTAAKLFYLLAIKTTASATYYTAYEHTPGGLSAIWPVDDTDHKAAQKEGFFYTASDRTAPQAYSIRETERGTDNNFLAARSLEKILQRRGRNTDFLQVDIIQGATTRTVLQNFAQVARISIEAITYFDKTNGNPYFSARIRVTGEAPQEMCMPFQYGNPDQIVSDALTELHKAGTINRQQYSSGASESPQDFSSRTGIEISKYICS